MEEDGRVARRDGEAGCMVLVSRAARDPRGAVPSASKRLRQLARFVHEVGRVRHSYLRWCAMPRSLPSPLKHNHYHRRCGSSGRSSDSSDSDSGGRDSPVDRAFLGLILSSWGRMPVGLGAVTCRIGGGDLTAWGHPDFLGAPRSSLVSAHDNTGGGLSATIPAPSAGGTGFPRVVSILCHPPSCPLGGHGLILTCLDEHGQVRR